MLNVGFGFSSAFDVDFINLYWKVSKKYLLIICDCVSVILFSNIARFVPMAWFKIS